MPLEHATSKQAFSRNVGREVAAGKPQKQAVAIAYATQRAASGDDADGTRIDHGVHTTDFISARRSRTPEGYLLCEEVPVARTGEMLYAEGEVPVEVGRDGLAHVYRDGEELFNDVTLRSLTGKDVTDEHPPAGQLVTPEVYAKLSKGVVLNPRAGITPDGDQVIYCDLLIKDKATIQLVEGGKVEVSAGYEADYDDLGDGEGAQTNIIFNHVALVDKGRCGPRCAIGDHDSVTTKESIKMPTVTVTPASAPIKKRATFLDKLRRLINDAEAEFGGMNPSAPGAISNMQATADEADCPEATDALDGADKSATHVHIHMHGAEDNDDHSLMSQTTDADPTGEANPTAASAGIGGDGGENQVTLESLAEELAMQRQLIMKLMQLQEKDLDADELARQSATSEGAEDGEEGAPEDEAAEGTETMDGVGTDDPVGASEADGPRDSDALGGADDSKRGKAVTGDSSALANDWRRLLSDANILVPGFRLPTFDAKAKRAATIDAMCSARRSALRTAYATADGATMLHTLSGMNDLNLEKLPCGEVKGLFTAAVGAKKLANNRSATADANRLPAGFQNEREATVVVGAMQTPAQLNDFYAKHYGPKAQ